MRKVILLLSLLLATVLTSDQLISLKLKTLPAEKSFVDGVQSNLYGSNQQTSLVEQMLKSNSLLGYQVPITNYYKTQYYVELQIGTPPQNFKLEVDTGSSDLWIQSTDCLTAGCMKHARFNSSASLTFNSTGNPFSIHYLGGDVSGYIASDTCKFGNQVVNNLTFGLAQSSSTLFDQVQFDGVLGLAFLNISSIKAPTLIDTLYNQGVISTNSFSIFLSRDQNNKDSEIILGGINPMYAETQFKFYPLYYDYQYVVKGNYISFNNTVIQVSSVVIDSGTSTISGDQSVLGPFADLFPSTIDCNNITGYPSLIINFNGDDYELLPEDYILSYTSAGVLYCRLGIKFFQLKTPGQIILGDTFMRRYYTYFDKTHDRVGFAKAASFPQSQYQQK